MLLNKTETKSSLPPEIVSLEGYTIPDMINDNKYVLFTKSILPSSFKMREFSRDQNLSDIGSGSNWSSFLF